MITDAMKAEGWIEHDGGECPVPLDSMVAVWRKGFWAEITAPADIIKWAKVELYRPEPKP